VLVLKKLFFFFFLVQLCCRLTPDGAELLKWEQEVLGVDLIESQFPGAGVGVATSATTTIKKVQLLFCMCRSLCFFFLNEV